MAISFGIWDILVIVLFIGSLIGVSVWSSRKVVSSESFSVADRSLTLKIMIGTTVATCLGAGSAVGNLGNTWSMGIAMIAIQGMWHIGWLVLIVIAKKLRESNATSIPDFFGKKFGPVTKAIASLVVLMFVINVTASQVAAVATIVEGFGLTSYKTAVLIAGVVIILFTVTGGLYSVAITDTIQAVLIVGGIGIALPVVAFSKAGGIGYVFANTNPSLLSLKSVSFPVLLGWLVSYILAAASNPGYIQRILSSKDVRTARLGTLWSDIIAFVFGTIMMLTVFCMPFLFPNLNNGDLFTSTAIMTLFPVGIRALILCALIGQVLSTADSFLLLIGTTAAEDIYQLFKPNTEPDKMLKIVRAFTIIGGVLAVFLSLSGKGILVIFKTGASAIGAGLAFPLFCACFWKKVRASAINAGALFGCFATIIWNQFFKSMINIDGVIIGALGCAIIVTVMTLCQKPEKPLGEKTA